MKTTKQQLLQCVIALWMVCSSITMYAATYYVAPGGSDTDQGSIDEPWETIQHAAETLEAGDSVLVRAGTYNTSIYFQNSGNEADGYITFMAYPGEEVIIDGTGIPEYQFGDMDGIINSQGKSYIRFIGFDIRNYETWFGVYFRGPASHIEIRDCKVSNGNVGDWGGHAMVMWGVIGEGCSPITDILIDGCEVFNNTTGGNEQLTMYGDVWDFQLTNNIVHDGTNINMDMIGQEMYEGQAFGRPRNGLVKGNICYNSGYGSWGDGIYIDGAGDTSLIDNIVVEENICYGNDYCGMSAGNEHTNDISGGILIRRNIFYENNYYGLHVGGSVDGADMVRHVKVYNNVMYNNNQPVLLLSTCEDVEFRNNIFYRNYSVPGGGFMWMGTNAENVTFDYNCWYPEGTIQWEGVEYPGLEAYRTASGQSQHGIFADPLFVDPENYDFHLQAESPCIDTGVYVGIPYVGSAPDIGIFEYSDAAVAVTSVRLSPAILSMPEGGTYTITANIFPTIATNRNVTWASQNSTVASVNQQGVITANTVGNTVITVNTEDGDLPAQCSVTVTEVLSAQNEIQTDIEDIYVYPNPLQENDLIISTDNDKAYDVMITDMKGVVVYTRKNNRNMLIVDEELFSEGMYMIKIHSEGKTKTISLVAE